MYIIQYFIYFILFLFFWIYFPHLDHFLHSHLWGICILFNILFILYAFCFFVSIFPTLITFSTVISGVYVYYSIFYLFYTLSVFLYLFSPPWSFSPQSSLGYMYIIQYFIYFIRFLFFCIYFPHLDHVLHSHLWGICILFNILFILYAFCFFVSIFPTLITFSDEMSHLCSSL